MKVEYSFPEEPALSNEGIISNSYFSFHLTVIYYAVKDFISKLLVRDNTIRATPDECRDHPWLSAVAKQYKQTQLPTKGK
jgi:hypothetical protein